MKKIEAKKRENSHNKNTKHEQCNWNLEQEESSNSRDVNNSTSTSNRNGI